MRPIDIFGGLFLGCLAGMFTFYALTLWGAAVWIGIGKRRRPVRYGLSPMVRVSTGMAAKRIFRFLPVLILVHPLPWLVVLIGWFAILLLRAR